VDQQESDSSPPPHQPQRLPPLLSRRGVCIFLGYVTMSDAKNRILRQILRGVISTGIVAFSISLPGVIYGQADSRAQLLECDDTVGRQDAVVSVALEQLGENSFLIVIIRPGVGEVSSQLAAKRLFNMKQYFRLRGSRLAADKLVLSTGATTKDLGRVEFYINGQLADALSYPRNGFICHACCGPDADFYPDRERLRRSLRRPAKKFD
jgi:hypothetical protein